MSKYKALIGFAGEISMYIGEERELPDNKLVKSLVKKKYIKQIKDELIDEEPQKEENKQTLVGESDET